ncbi:hypothetical protein HELRODRAFT_189947 [Helobdella robusta]|uniref:Uncharacterized protein n=1 Tax=Helobdella robusta TaxID=6412 RepID=T1FRI8_HELRO|nr:hypothetical protein HELRODRAFT_189947 [Helobdella robusta]ESN90679.1 hypothetical protein HELRODRAFT_189947 [Helobdella robusta]
MLLTSCHLSTERPIKTKKITENTFLLTYFNGDVSDQVDEHFRRAIELGQNKVQGRCQGNPDWRKHRQFMLANRRVKNYDDDGKNDNNNNLSSLQTIAEEYNIIYNGDTNSNCNFNVINNNKNVTNYVTSDKQADENTSSKTGNELVAIDDVKCRLCYGGFYSHSCTSNNHNNDNSRLKSCCYDKQQQQHFDCQVDKLNCSTTKQHFSQLQNNNNTNFYYNLSPQNINSNNIIINNNNNSILQQQQRNYTKYPPQPALAKIAASCRFAGLPTFGVVRRRSFTEEFAIAPIPTFNFDYSANNNTFGFDLQAGNPGFGFDVSPVPNIIPIRSYTQGDAAAASAVNGYFYPTGDLYDDNNCKYFNKNVNLCYGSKSYNSGNNTGNNLMSCNNANNVGYVDYFNNINNASNKICNSTLSSEYKKARPDTNTTFSKMTSFVEPDVNRNTILQNSW